jgi:DNA-binding NarL/FixJ family response regulator
LQKWCGPTYYGTQFAKYSITSTAVFQTNQENRTHISSTVANWLCGVNREIAEALYISEKTVKNNISNILSRLNLHDRTQLAILALQAPDNPPDL